MMENNIAPNTQIGRIVIDEKVYDHENTYHIDKEKYSRGGEFIENMCTDNIIQYCHRWFHLANFQEMLDDINEYYNGYGFGLFTNIQSAWNIPVQITPKGKKECPVEFGVRNSRISPVEFYNKHPENMNYDELLRLKEENAKV